MAVSVHPIITSELAGETCYNSGRVSAASHSNMPPSLFPCSTTRQTGSDWCLDFTCIEVQLTEWNVFIHHYVMDVFPERILICM